MYLDVKESLALAGQLHGIQHQKDTLQVVLFPSALAFCAVREALKETSFSLGAQNVNWVPKGAYTGAVSARMFAATGATHALVGHSERRYIFGETNDDVRKKIEACFDAGITPVVCVGETKEDRENGKEEYRIKKQIMKALDGLVTGGKELVIAYEPVWAISKGGAGTPCDPAEAERMIVLVREEARQYMTGDIPVVYGGSVGAENVLSYAGLDAVDGVLPGHASTRYKDMANMINALGTL